MFTHARTHERLLRQRMRLTSRLQPSHKNDDNDRDGDNADNDDNDDGIANAFAWLVCLIALALGIGCCILGILGVLCYGKCYMDTRDLVATMTLEQSLPVVPGTYAPPTAVDGTNDTSRQ